MAYEISDIFNFYKYVSILGNKAQTGLKLKIENFNRLAPIIQWKGIKRKYQIPEQFNAGVPFNKEMYEFTQANIDSMSRFKVAMGLPYKTAPLSVDSNGYAVLPANYLHVSSIGYSSVNNSGFCTSAKSENIIEPLTDAEWNGRINDAIAPASTKYPICRFFFENGRYFIQVAPVGLKFINFVYLRKPNTPYLDNTLDETNKDGFVYNQSASVQFDMSENDIIDLAPIMLAELAENIREPFLLQVNENKKNTGI